MPDWIPPLLASFAGSGVAVYAGIRVLMSQMADVREWVKELRKRAHDNHNAILKLEGRHLMLEDRVKRLEDE